MLGRSLELKDKMGCPYCYLAARLRSPCPCSIYQSTGSFNSALSPNFSVSTRTNSDGDNMIAERESEQMRAGGWEMGVKEPQSLNEFERLSPLRFPYFYFSYPMSPIVYFGAKALPQVSTAQPFKVASSESMRPVWAQLHPELTSPLRRERTDLNKVEEPRKEEYHSSVTATERAKTQNVKTHNHENAWRGPTYTELITEAILSTPEHRMTLSQIYDWITENVEYFRERKNHTSARGWKNAVRHTLSLRKRFSRVARTNGAASWYNSWWTINENQMTRRRGKLKTVSTERTSNNV